MCRRITASSVCPTLSAKYPSHQKLAPPQELFQFLELLAYDPATAALQNIHHLRHRKTRLELQQQVDVVGFAESCFGRLSPWKFSSCSAQSFTSQACRNSSSIRTAIAPSNTRLRYLGIQTRWNRNRCVCFLRSKRTGVRPRLIRSFRGFGLAALVHAPSIIEMSLLYGFCGGGLVRKYAVPGGQGEPCHYAPTTALKGGVWTRLFG